VICSFLSDFFVAMPVFRLQCNDDTSMTLWSTGGMVTADDEEELNLNMST
jgi:hypothetical protein